MQSSPYTVNGNYSRPTVGDYTGDGIDDALWYAPGTASDYLWDFNPGGSFVSTPRTINGTFLPVSGSFGNDATDDIVWYAPGPALDYLWDFTPGSTAYTSATYSVSTTTYRPFSLDIFGDGPGNHDIFWYAPGPAADGLWDFWNGVKYASPERVDGYYVTAPGDFFADGHDDIVWDNDTTLAMWEHTVDRERIGWIWTAAPSDAEARSAVDVSPAGPTSGTARRVSSESVERH